LTTPAIYLPPLRERREDILPLAECFIGRVGSRLGRRFTAIEADSHKQLTEFSWPGNIRQLQNVIEHTAILCDHTATHSSIAARRKAHRVSGAAGRDAAHK
jgi:DNA-binding NtrC family response regulator